MAQFILSMSSRSYAQIHLDICIIEAQSTMEFTCRKGVSDMFGRARLQEVDCLAASGMK
jgi:hypothetical protein